MGYIYKNIAANTAFTEIVPLNTINSFSTITITNTGGDCAIDVYLYKISSAGVVETIYILHDTFMSFDVTLVLDPSDFTFDNSLYSLRFETTTSADIIVDASSERYLAIFKDSYITTVPSSLQARFASDTYTYVENGVTRARTSSYIPTWQEAVSAGKIDTPRMSIDKSLIVIKGDFDVADNQLTSNFVSAAYPYNHVLTEDEALLLFEGKLFNKNHK